SRSPRTRRRATGIWPRRHPTARSWWPCVTAVRGRCRPAPRRRFGGARCIPTMAATSAIGNAVEIAEIRHSRYLFTYTTFYVALAETLFEEVRINDVRHTQSDHTHGFKSGRLHSQERWQCFVA